MKNTLETRLGIFFALALIVLFLIMEVIGSFDYFKRGMRVRAYFDSIKELRVGDPVRLAGYDVGRVASVDVASDRNRIEVILKIDDTRGIKTDSFASIQFAGLMGQNFVGVTFGSPGAPPLTDGSSIQTVEQPDLGTLMVRLDAVAAGVENLTKSFTGDDIQNLLGPFTDFLKENGPRLSEILADTRTITAQVAQGEGTVGKLIMDDVLHESALTAVSSLQDTTRDLQATFAQAREVVTQMNEGQGTFGRLLTDETLYMETTAAMVNLREIFEKINFGEGTIGKIVNDPALYRNVQVSLQKLDKATETLEDQGPISVLGIAIGSLF
jgi:phospholipid/cholesterol/gamma-HCH transport system substrate-binding protein